MADVLAASKRDGKPLKARQDYMMELVAERMTGSAMNHFVTDDMQHGLDHEGAAKLAYTEVTGNAVLPSGFMLHPTLEYCGATPDGFVGDDGLIEIKCPRTTTHIAWKLAGVVPEQHRPQMTLQLAVTGRKWCDFVSFDPRCPPRQRVYLIRFEPTAEEIEQVELAAKLFLMETDKLFEQVTAGSDEPLPLPECIKNGLPKHSIDVVAQQDVIDYALAAIAPYKAEVNRLLPAIASYKEACERHYERAEKAEADNAKLRELLAEAKKYVGRYHGDPDRPVTKSDLFKRIVDALGETI
jgi:exodeoxyribonuclease (lambda-induced)